jgi:hypothetical protein
MFFAALDAAKELVDGGGLIAARLIVAVELEVHGEGLLADRRLVAKPSLYAGSQVSALD